jgi:hypothetical protein
LKEIKTTLESSRGIRAGEEYLNRAWPLFRVNGSGDFLYMQFISGNFKGSAQVSFHNINSSRRAKSYTCQAFYY